MERVAFDFKVNKIELFYRYCFIFYFNDFLCLTGAPFKCIALIKNLIFLELKSDYFRHIIIVNQTHQRFILQWWNFTSFFIIDFILFWETVFINVINSLEFLLQSVRFIQTNSTFIKKRLNLIFHNERLVENIDDFARKHPLRKLHLMQFTDHNSKLIKRQHPH